MTEINIYQPWKQESNTPEIEKEYVASWQYSNEAKGYVCNKCGCQNRNLPAVPDYSPLLYVGANFCPNCGRAMTKDGITILLERMGLNTTEDSDETNS